MVRLPYWNRFRIARQSRAMCLTVVLGLIPALAQAPKTVLKPTERVIKRYEKYIASGALLTPEGWSRASRLFDRSDPYPQNGEIEVVSTGGLVAENWMRGDEAEVETKWDDFYGSIDAALRYKPALYGHTIMMGQRFAMVRVPQQLGDEKDKTAGTSGPAEWKIKGPQSVRYATISAAIQYVERIREQSKDPAIRENARKTIAALKRVSQGCGSASAC